MKDGYDVSHLLSLIGSMDDIFIVFFNVIFKVFSNKIMAFESFTKMSRGNASHAKSC